MSKLIRELTKDVEERCLDGQELMLSEEEMGEYLFKVFKAMSDEYEEVINNRNVGGQNYDT